MSTRTFSLLFLPLLLAACSDVGEPLPGAAIECALDGSAQFAPDCTMEQQARDEASLLIVHHPDGGFRRFEQGVAGRSVVTADGMEQAVTAPSDDVLEISVGADRYRLPVAE